MNWAKVEEPERRRALLLAAARRVQAARSVAENGVAAVPAEERGEIWVTEDDASVVWVIPRDGEVILADVRTVEPAGSAWRELDGIAAVAGWSGVWHFSSFAGEPVMAALAEAADARRVATKMRVDVAEVPAPTGVRLQPMDEADFAAYRAVADEDYAQERFASGAEPTIEDSRRVAAEQMAELLPDGPQTPGHRLWTVRDEVGERAGVLWVHLGDDVAFIYDISLDEDRRGQGLGTQALQAGARETAEAGLDVLALNVFGSNDGARRLYAREGYRETEVIWSAPIAE